MAKRRNQSPVKRLRIHAARVRPLAERDGKKYGISTGLRLCAFIDELFYANYREQLTDPELLAAVKAEFRNREKQPQDMIAYRTYFNGNRNSQGIGYKLTGANRLPPFGNGMHSVRPGPPRPQPPLPGQVVKPKKRRATRKPRQVDPLLRCEVEKAAVQKVTAHFRKQGYTVNSHEKDNVGWDLLATRRKRELRLEVKGLAASGICVELTPNEYAAMRKWQTTYHVCIVTDALTDPTLAVFGYSPDSDKWQDARKRTLRISPIVAARCSVG